jgi:hypothetical protein
MFCAAMLLACPGVEISIYSTCKRISQTILRNVQKFALMIADDEYASLHFAVKRENMEEINLQGLECSNCPLSDFFFYMQTLLVVHPFECPPSFQCMSLLCKLARTPPARFTPYSLATNIQLECEQPRACEHTSRAPTRTLAHSTCVLFWHKTHDTHIFHHNIPTFTHKQTRSRAHAHTHTHTHDARNGD